MSDRNTIARPYAKAVFEEAFAHRALDSWTKFLGVAAWVSQQEKIQRVLADPVYTPQKRFETLNEICGSTESAQQNFLELLAQNNRLDVLPEIFNLFEQYRLEQEKLAQVEVTSATALTTTERQQLKEALEVRLQREVTLECNVDPSLIGGLKIRTDNNLVIDSSVRGKLERLGSSLLNI